jgi:hypothetical protein
MLAAWLVGVFDVPGNPQETPFEPRPGPFIALTVLGLFIAGFGHLVKSKTAVASGLAMAFLGIILLPLFLYLSGNY